MEENWFDWVVRTKEQMHGYLLGAALSPRRFEATSTDHYHCEICWAKFSAEPEDLHFGFYEEKSNSWICESCFHDFKAHFDWTVVETPGESEEVL